MPSKHPPKTLNEFLEGPFFYYKIIGFDPCNRNTKFSRSHLQQAFFCVGLINLSLLACSQTVMIFGSSIANLEDRSAAFICVFYTVIFYGKIVTLILKKETLCELLDVVDHIFPRTSKQRRDLQYFQFDSELSIIVRLIKYASIVTIYLYVTTSVILSFYGLFTSGNYLYLLPIPIWRTFDRESILLYAFLYVHQSYGVHLCNCGIMATDLFLCHLVTLFCMFFSYVSNVFSEMEAKRDYDNLEKLRALVSFHDKILWMSTTINEIFNISVLLNLALSSVNLCMLGFKVINGIGILDFFRHAFLMGVQIMQVANVCYLGMRLTECSTKISMSAFHHIRFSKDINYQKNLLWIIQRSQRAAVINAPLLSMVSMETLRKVFSVAFQFFTLLNSIKN